MTKLQNIVRKKLEWYDTNTGTLSANISKINGCSHRLVIHIFQNKYPKRSLDGIVVAWWLDLQLHMQSVPITTKVVSSNPAHGEVHSIQPYVIKFVNDLWAHTPVSSTNKTDRHDIIVILLKVALNIIPLTLSHWSL